MQDFRESTLFQCYVMFHYCIIKAATFDWPRQCCRMDCMLEQQRKNSVKCLSLLFTPQNRSGKWLCLKGKYYWREPFLTSMIIGGWVNEQQVLGHNRQAFLSLNRVVMTRCKLFFPSCFWSDLGNDRMMVVWASKDCHCPKKVWMFRSCIVWAFCIVLRSFGL